MGPAGVLMVMSALMPVSAASPLLLHTQLLMAALLLLLQVQLQHQPQRLQLLRAPTLRTVTTVTLWWLKTGASLILSACRVAIAATILLRAVLILSSAPKCLRPC